VKRAGKNLGNTLGLKVVPHWREYYAKPELISISNCMKTTSSARAARLQRAIVYFRSLRHTRTKMTTAMIPKMSNPAITANTIKSSLLPESISQHAPLSDSLLKRADVRY
jgi:hypothetical protein